MLKTTSKINKMAAVWCDWWFRLSLCCAGVKWGYQIISLSLIIKYMCVWSCVYWCIKPSNHQTFKPFRLFSSLTVSRGSCRCFEVEGGGVDWQTWQRNSEISDPYFYWHLENRYLFYSLWYFWLPCLFLKDDDFIKQSRVMLLTQNHMNYESRQDRRRDMFLTSQASKNKKNIQFSLVYLYKIKFMICNLIF